MNNENIIEIKNVDIKAISDYVVKACSKDNNRAGLTGVNFQVDGDSYTATATNGHFMQVHGELRGKSFPAFIVPASAIRELKKQKVKKCDIAVDVNGTIDFIIDAEVVLQAQKVDSIYPDYHMCVPQYYDNECTFQAGVLSEALKKLEGVVDGVNKAVRIFCEKDVMHVYNTPSSIRTDEEMKDFVQVKCDVPAITNNEHGIAFNIEYIKKAIARFHKNDWVTLKFNSPLSASLWCGEKETSWTTLLMPVRCSA